MKNCEWDIIIRVNRLKTKKKTQTKNTLHKQDNIKKLWTPTVTDTWITQRLVISSRKKKIKNHKSTSPKLFDHFLCEKKRSSSFEVALRTQLDYHLRLNKIWWKVDKLLLAGLFITSWSWIRWSILGISDGAALLGLHLNLYVPLSLHRCIWEPAAALCVQSASVSESD